MPNVSIASIRTALATKIGEVTQIKQALVGRTEAFTKFPGSRSYLMGVTDEIADTNNQYRTYKFAIEIVHLQAVQGVTKENSEAAFQDAVDAVMDKLNTQWDLAGLEHSAIESGIVQLVESSQGPALVMTLIWQARTLISLT